MRAAFFFAVVFFAERVLYRRVEGGVIISEVEGKVFLRGKALYCKDMKAVETLIKGIKRGWGRRNILNCSIKKSYFCIEYISV